MLPDIDSTFFHVLCGNLIVSNGSLYVYFFEINLRNLLYVIIACLWWLLVEVLLVSKNQQKTAQWLTKERLKVPKNFEDIGSF